MRYLVFGAGAVGGYLGVKLARSGQPVTFLVRPDSAEAFLRRGLVLEEDGRSLHLRQPDAVDSVESGLATHPDLILLTVKAYDCQAAAKAIAQATDGPPPTVSFLNGVDNEAALAHHLTPQRVVPATLTSAIRISEPGRLRLEVRRGIGLASGHASIPHLQRELAAAGIRVRRYAEAAEMKWSKLLTNLLASATSAVLGWPPERILAHPGLYRLEIEVQREALRVMGAMGYTPRNLPGAPVAWLARLVHLPLWISQPLLRLLAGRGRGSKMPALHDDVRRGRTEVSWLHGAVARYGGDLGMSTPANAMLAELVTRLAERRLEASSLRQQPAALLERAAAAGVSAVRRYNRPGS